MADKINKFFNSEYRVLKRSQIHPADYNPRTIDPEGKKNLKRSLKKFGVLGGIVVNSRTGYTIVGGHQKVLLLDEEFGYPDNDYEIRAEVIDVDEATEKTINVTLNNPSVGGQWDYDKMRELIPDIDYKSAGLTDADLSMIGVDFLFQTEQENQIADDLNALMAEANQKHAQEVEQRKAERAMEREAARAYAEANGTPQPQYYSDDPDDEDEEFDDEEFNGNGNTNYTPTTQAPQFDPEEDRARRIAQMKELKQNVKDKAAERAQNMDAYIALSFDTWDAKAEFCERFGINPLDRFVKGEWFGEMVERVDI